MTPWYVVQVMSGQEGRALALIEAQVERAGVKECFIPRYQTQRKVRGAWSNVERPLIPGYLIAVTDTPDKLEGVLWKLPMFAKLLRNEDGFTPLERNEVAWFEAFTHEHDRTVHMSIGVKEGDEVIITSGPLQQHVARITRIDRRRSMAYVRISFLGRMKEVPLGLKVLAKRG